MRTVGPSEGFLESVREFDDIVELEGETDITLPSSSVEDEGSISISAEDKDMCGEPEGETGGVEMLSTCAEEVSGV